MFLKGKIVSLIRRDVLMVARVEVGVEMEVHLTLAARDALALGAGREVWLVLKTHFLPSDVDLKCRRLAQPQSWLSKSSAYTSCDPTSRMSSTSLLGLSLNQGDSPTARGETF